MPPPSNGKIQGDIPGTYFLTIEASRTREGIITAFGEEARRFGCSRAFLPLLYPAGTFIGSVLPKKYSRLVGQVFTPYAIPNQSAELAYELTVPVSIMMQKAELTQGRFFYTDRVVRLEEEEDIEKDKGRRFCEFYQLGFEDYVLGQIDGDVQAIRVFRRFTGQLGLESTVRASNVEILRTFLTDKGLSEKQRIVIKNRLDKSEFGELESYCASEGIGDEVRDKVLEMGRIGARGGSAGTLDEGIGKLEKIFPAYGWVIDKMRRFSCLLKGSGDYDRVALDQTAQRGLGFYSNIGLQGDIGDAREVLGGGDYEITYKGTVWRGSGFGIGLERLEDILSGRKGGSSSSAPRIVFSDDAAEAMRAQRMMFDAAPSEPCEVFVGDRAAALEYALGKGGSDARVESAQDAIGRLCSMAGGDLA